MNKKVQRFKVLRVHCASVFNHNFTDRHKDYYSRNTKLLSENSNQSAK